MRGRSRGGSGERERDEAQVWTRWTWSDLERDTSRSKPEGNGLSMATGIDVLDPRIDKDGRGIDAFTQSNRPVRQFRGYRVPRSSLWIAWMY